MLLQGVKNSQGGHPKKKSQGGPRGREKIEKRHVVFKPSQIVCLVGELGQEYKTACIARD